MYLAMLPPTTKWFANSVYLETNSLNLSYIDIYEHSNPY